MDRPWEHALYSIADWQYDVANGDTKLGYMDWVAHNLESHGQGCDACDVPGSELCIKLHGGPNV